MNSILRFSTAVLLAMVFSSTSLLIGCKSKNSNQAANSQNAGPSTPQNQPAAQMSVDDLVAPIALYPDQLLAQVLTLTTNSQEVLDVGNWLLQNQNLQGDALTNAAKQAGFSPSAQYLVLFPQVVDNMCQEIDWTRQLGEAFQADQKGVMDAVQRKRVQAQQMGNLSSSPQMAVQTKQTDNGQQYVEIKPADPKVVYVPQYNPVTIYNNPAPAVPAQTTVVQQQSGVSTGTAVAIGLLSFGIGMAVGSAIHQDNYYPYPAWGYGGGVYYGGRPYYPPPYRPVYPGYRPAYGYHPPGNYQWNQYNRNVNVNVNNNYYGRFNKTNVSTLPANTRPGYGNQNLANNNRPGAANQGTWKGQTTYQGARNNNNLGNQRPGASMANAVPRNQQVGNRANVGNTAATTNRSTMAANRNLSRPNAGTAGNMNRAGAQPVNRAASQPMNRASASPQPKNRGGDRGYSNTSRPTASAASRPSPNLQAQNRGGAFGGSGSGGSDRAASGRGRSSMGAPQRGARRSR
jgi:hypothetical protein